MISPTRVFGLSGSGLDIDSIVSGLMKVQRVKQDKIKQNQTIAEWQRSDYRDMNNSLRALRDNVFNMKLQGTFLTKNATSSNEGIVKATANISAVAGVNNVQVTQLANNARLNSVAGVTFDATKSTLKDQLGLAAGTVTFTVNGSQSITIDTSVDSIDTLVSKINSAKMANGTSAGVSASFDKTLKRMFISSTATGSSAQVNFATVPATTDPVNLFSALKLGSSLNSTDAVSFNSGGANLAAQLGITSGAINFTINGKAIALDSGTNTMNDLVNAINTSGAGVTANFDTVQNKLFITNGNGVSGNIDIATDVAGTDPQGLFAALKLSSNPGFNLSTASVVPDASTLVAKGVDAKIILNGVSLTEAGNQFTISGVNYTLTGTSSSQTVNVSVANDTDAVYNSIKSFVDLYNTTIDKVNSKISEERYKDYLPLTDDQRAQLTTDQQKQWEDKAKSGLLRNDSLLSGIVNNMRSTLYSIVGGVDTNYNSLSDIGITTGDYSEKGKLYINEQKLKDAIAANPQSVMDLFSKSSSVTGEKGLAVRLYDDLTGGINQIINKAGSENSYSMVDNSVLGQKITDYNKQILDWDSRLQDMENRYYTQYSAMETALSKMNQQSAWLTQQLGGSSK
ncbi:MAG: Flagellar hook-associated protein 2 [Pelotomaculum sp. PtaU1.Bin035]|nr:MAG: Flagellar hook-associated protein 2 [Pelotomaculum sp. PtaU1.Bin035]